MDGAATAPVEINNANEFGTAQAAVPKKALSKLLNCAIVFV
jgi:hypothetical protein